MSPRTIRTIAPRAWRPGMAPISTAAQTANGEIFDSESISAAHPTLPLPSYVRVTNLGNGHSLIVRVNDRGPYAANRLIDVSKRAAHLLGLHRPRHRLRARRICRARADRRLRRPPAGGNFARERTGAGAMGYATCRHEPDPVVPAAAAAGSQSALRQCRAGRNRERRHAGFESGQVGLRQASQARRCPMRTPPTAPTAPRNSSTAAGSIDLRSGDGDPLHRVAPSRPILSVLFGRQ